jgi:hypothetical protein
MRHLCDGHTHSLNYAGITSPLETRRVESDAEECLTCSSMSLEPLRCVIHGCSSSWCSDYCVPARCEGHRGKPVCMGHAEYIDGLAYCPECAAIERADRKTERRAA